MAVGLVGVFLGVVLLPGHEAAWRVGLDDLMQLGAALFAAWACSRRARRATGRSRKGWMFLYAGLLSWSGGQALWFYVRDVRQEILPDVGIADAFYLAYVPLTALGVLMVPRFLFLRRTRWRIALEATFVTLCLFLVGWVVVLQDLAAMSDQSAVVRFIAPLYPASNLLPAALALLVHRHAPTAQIVQYRLLAFGFLAVAVGETAYAREALQDEFYSGGVVDVAWFAGFLAIGMAARLPPAVGVEARLDPSIALPLGSAAVALAAFVGAAVAGTVDVTLWSLGVLAAVIAAFRLGLWRRAVRP